MEPSSTPNWSPSTPWRPTTTSAPASAAWSRSFFRVLAAQLLGVGHDHRGAGVDLLAEQLVLPARDPDVDALVVEHPGHRLAPVVLGVARVERVGEGRGVPGEDRDDHEDGQHPECDPGGRCAARTGRCSGSRCPPPSSRHHARRPAGAGPVGAARSELRLQLDGGAGAGLVRWAVVVPRLVEDRRHRLETMAGGSGNSSAARQLISWAVTPDCSAIRPRSTRPDARARTDSITASSHRCCCSAAFARRRCSSAVWGASENTAVPDDGRAGLARSRESNTATPTSSRARRTSAARRLRPPPVAVASRTDVHQLVEPAGDALRKGSWYSGRASSSCNHSRAVSGSGNNDPGIPVWRVARSRVTAAPDAATG